VLDRAGAGIKGKKGNNYLNPDEKEEI